MKKIIILLSSIIISMGATKATLLNFIDLTLNTISNSFSEVHFPAPGNDFIGAIFWLPNKSFSFPLSVDLNGESKLCKKQLRGLYYTNARGERLWPLDPYTLQTLQTLNKGYNDLIISGGLYTTCYDDPYSIYGQISYNINGTKSYLTAGTSILFQQNKIGTHFAKIFQYFNNILPLGYIVDNIGGIGFVGGYIPLNGHDCLSCLLNNDSDCSSVCGNDCTGSSINDLFILDTDTVRNDPNCPFSFVKGIQSGSAQDVQWGINVQGKVGLSNVNDTTNKQALLGNNNQKNTVINTPDVTTATLVNSARRSVSRLCKGKTIYSTTSLPISNDNVICIAFDNYDTNRNIVIDLLSTSYAGKVIAIKNANVILRNSMTNLDNYLDLFIDNGNLYIENINNTGLLMGFDNKGFPNNSNYTSKGIFIQGNIIINGIIAGISPTGNIENIKNKLYIHGKVSSLNSLSASSDGKQSQIQELFKTDIFKDYIGLQNVLEWNCNPITGIGTDGTNCKDDPFATYPLIIIDNKLIKSRLLN